MIRTTMAIAAAGLLAAPALAQQGDELTVEEARSFLEGAAGELQTAVEEGNWTGMRGWLNRHLADDGDVALAGSLVSHKGPTMTYAFSAEGAEMERVAMMMMGRMRALGPALDDYQVSFDIQDVSDLAGGQIAANVAYLEYGSIDFSQLAQGEGAEAAAQAQMGLVTWQDQGTCMLKLGREGDVIMIYVAACESHTVM